jgi:cell division protein FtsQ
MKLKIRRRSKRVTTPRRIKISRIRYFPGVFLSVLLLSLLAYLLGWSHLLSLKTVAISGSSQSEVITQQIETGKPGVKIGQPLARLDVHAIERAISNNPWIAKSQVGRSWIHGELTIHIVEKVPVASYQLADGSTGYFDADGHDFTSPLTYTGVPTIALHATSTSAKQSIAKLLALLPASYLDRAKTFAVKSDGEIKMTLDQEMAVTTGKKASTRTITIIWGDSTDIALKIQVFEKLVAMKENAQSHLFDLSDPLAPISK